jgi:hypothetical protein
MKRGWLLSEQVMEISHTLPERLPEVSITWQQILVLHRAMQIRAHCPDPSLGTHQPPPWCPSFLLLPPFPHPPLHACDSLTWPLFLTRQFPPQHTLTLFLVFFLDKQKRPFSGSHKLLFLSPIGSLGGHVRAHWFHSVPQQANEDWGPLFHFPPASYIIRNFWPANYSACHLLSSWYIDRLIRPWRWRRYVPLECRLTFNELHGVIS